MKIEVGEYVRTKKGEIHKVIEIKENRYIIDFDDYFYYRYDNNMGGFKSNIVNHSKNIIDLIEVGDYVNGYRVENTSVETNEVLLDHNGFGWRTLKDGDKIVTHEQFKSVEYEVN